MPYEKSLFDNFIDISQYADIVHAYNITLTDDNCAESQIGYDAYNQHLHDNCLFYIGCASFALLCVFFKDLRNNYIAHESLTMPFISMIDEVYDTPKRDTFAVYYWNHSWFVAEFIKTLQFMSVVGIFEYVFFITVVNKYKIVNFKIILCNIQT